MEIKITDVVLPEGVEKDKYSLAVQLLKSSEYPDTLTKEDLYKLVESLVGIRPIEVKYETVE